MSDKPAAKKPAPKKAPKKAAKPKPENQVKRLQGRVKALEDRVENLVQVVSNRLGFNPDNEPVDIIETGESGEPTSAPDADAE